jgi:hypothetical protein
MPSAGRQLNYAVLIGYALGGLFSAACLSIAFVMQLWWLNVATCLFGFALGWNVGMLLSPKEYEKQQFAGYGKAISAFIGGFLVAKIDAAFGGAELKRIVADPVIVGRLLLFGTTFFFGVQSTYVGRRYSIWLKDEKQEVQPGGQTAA